MWYKYRNSESKALQCPFLYVNCRGIMNCTKNASTVLEERVLLPVGCSDKMLEAVRREGTIDYAYNIHHNTVP